MATATATATMEDFVALGVARWADPEMIYQNFGKRVEHVPVHVFRHKGTGQLHVILVEDERVNPAPTYIVEESALILPPGGLLPR